MKGRWRNSLAEVLQFPLLFAEDEDISEERGAVARDDVRFFADAPAREAALDIRRSWIVEAPAGSGKTGLLIQRFLKLLAFGEVGSPREVLAITFTRKAANELRSRILEQLAAAAKGDPLTHDAGDYEETTRQLAEEVLARDRSLGWQILSSPHILNIRTIDAFCGDLAGSQPLLAGGAGRLRPVDDASLLYEEAAERTLRQLGSNGIDPMLDEALRTVLYHRDAQITDAIRLIANMLGGREQWGTLVPLEGEQLTEAVLNGPIRERLEQTLAAAIQAGLLRAARAISPDLLEELAKLAARLACEPGFKGGTSPLSACSDRSSAPGDAVSDLPHWLALGNLVMTLEGKWRKALGNRILGFDLPKAAAPVLRDLVDRFCAEDERSPGLREALCDLRTLPPAEYPNDQWNVVKALLRVLRHALAELKVLFAERGLCDFMEISLTARALLHSAPDLLQLPGARLTHLLVDEMQDTSAGQYELLELLTRSWDGFSQTVFLVGDPKQSIYLFRQARVARFLRTQATERLGELPLGSLRLTTNFRSQAELVQTFNEVFRLVLPQAGLRAQETFGEAAVPFVAAEAARGPGSTPALHWHVRRAASRGASVVEPEEEPLEDVTSRLGPEEDALRLREEIGEFQRRWLARRSNRAGSPAPPKIAVLARSRAHLAPVITEFKRDRGDGPMPFTAVDVELLDERREVLDLLALTRALLHPGDRVAWFAVLRSPVCGLTLSDLLALAGEGADAAPEATVPYLVRTRACLLSSEGQQLLARAWSILSVAQQSRGTTDLCTQVERTWRSLGGDTFLRPEQRTNASRYLELLREVESRPQPVNLPALERALGKLYAAPQIAQGAVELMTIHKAKGLEWDLVLVPALAGKTQANGHKLLKWLELDGQHGADTEVILSPIQGKGEDSSKLSKWLGRLEAAREIAESKRLLYVACTRAREELHLFASCELKADGSLRTPPAGSLLHAGWAAAEPALLPLLDSMRGGSAARPPFEVSAVTRGSDMPLALAASGEDNDEGQEITRPSGETMTVERLPPGFNPLQRFDTELNFRLPYPAAADLRHAAAFGRPEGSFRARAFGNAVHRFLDFAAERMSEGTSADSLLLEMPSWHRRVQTTLRAEGLAPVVAARDADRAVRALEATLRHPEGRWLLTPSRGASSERTLRAQDAQQNAIWGRVLRADRILSAGARPLSSGTDTHLWIADYKTADAGGRPLAAFFESEQAKYQSQLETYAAALQMSGKETRPIMLALYYPLLTHLLYWPYELKNASDSL